MDSGGFGGFGDAAGLVGFCGNFVCGLSAVLMLRLVELNCG